MLAKVSKQTQRGWKSWHKSKVILLENVSPIQLSELGRRESISMWSEGILSEKIKKNSSIYWNGFEFSLLCEGWRNLDMSVLNFFCCCLVIAKDACFFWGNIGVSLFHKQMPWMPIHSFENHHRYFILITINFQLFFWNINIFHPF